MKKIQEIGKKLFSEVWPLFCLHCGEKSEHLLCKGCFSLMDIRKDPLFPLHNPIVAPFYHEGPVKDLLRLFRLGKAPFLGKTLASWMVMRYLQFSLPTPSWIVPIPTPFFSKISIGYNPAALLALEVGVFLNIPVVPLLRCNGIRLSQENLQLAQRRNASSNRFSWSLGTLFHRRCKELEEKRILLIDDLAVTGATLKSARLFFAEHGAQRVDQLVVSCAGGEIVT